MNEHVNLLKAYLEELCSHIERRERALPWPKWRKRVLASTAPLAMGLTMASCAADIEPEQPTKECVGEECATLCADQTDNDSDDLVDCADDDCAAAANCGATPVYAAPLTETLCSDNLDNDGDKAIDCADEDCAAAANCGAVALYGIVMSDICNDQRDNDGDDLIDCADDDCAAATNCGSVAEYGVFLSEICDDQRDNDGDRHVDCGDTDCSTAANCVGVAAETNCQDGVDNDSDGLVDCDDAECLCSVAIYMAFMEKR